MKVDENSFIEKLNKSLNQNSIFAGKITFSDVFLERHFNLKSHLK